MASRHTATQQRSGRPVDRRCVQPGDYHQPSWRGAISAPAVVSTTAGVANSVTTGTPGGIVAATFGVPTPARPPSPRVRIDLVKAHATRGEGNADRVQGGAPRGSPCWSGRRRGGTARHARSTTTAAFMGTLVATATPIVIAVTTVPVAIAATATPTAVTVTAAVAAAAPSTSTDIPAATVTAACRHDGTATAPPVTAIPVVAATGNGRVRPAGVIFPQSPLF